MGDMTFPEIAVYAVLIITNCVITWQWAKHGLLEIGIQIPPNTKAIGAVVVGVITLFIAGFAEREGYLSLSLVKEENMVKGALIIVGSPIIIFFLARYLLLPKGLPEYNRARNRTLFWTGKHYQPGEKLEVGNDLVDFPMAQKALCLFQKSIEFQSKKDKGGTITEGFPIDTEQLDWSGNMQLPCPNCGWRIKTPVSSEHGSGFCTTCGAGVGFRVIDNIVHLTAFGSKVRKEITPSSKRNIATAYEEMALLLRMMNKFDEALKALDKAGEIINSACALNDFENDKPCLAVKSLIFFRRGEIAHTLGDRKKAKHLYQQSLAIDEITGDNKERSFVTKLINEIS